MPDTPSPDTPVPEPPAPDPPARDAPAPDAPVSAAPPTDVSDSAAPPTEDPTHRVRVRYAEADQQGIVFNAHWLTYADDAVTRFFERLGYDPGTLWAVGAAAPFDIMVRRSELDFAGPARFDEWVDLRVHATRLGRTSFDLEVAGSVGGRAAVTVTTTYVTIDPSTHRPIPIPDDLRPRLAATVPGDGAGPGEAGRVSR